MGGGGRISNHPQVALARTVLCTYLLLSHFCVLSTQQRHHLPPQAQQSFAKIAQEN